MEEFWYFLLPPLRAEGEWPLNLCPRALLARRRRRDGAAFSQQLARQLLIGWPTVPPCVLFGMARVPVHHYILDVYGGLDLPISFF